MTTAQDYAAKSETKDVPRPTPGPWNVREEPLLDGRFAIDPYIATTTSHTERDAANARLMAAAPCLLAALIELRLAVIRDGKVADALDNALAVIVKAEGKSPVSIPVADVHAMTDDQIANMLRPQS